MLDIRQKFNTFIRDFDESVYLFNSETKKDLFVDKSGGVFLSQLNREWKSLDSIVDALLQLFHHVQRDVLWNDAIEFYGYLYHKGFLEIRNDGIENSIPEVSGLDESGVLSPLVKQVPDTTQVHLMKMFSKNPRILSLQVELTNLCNERCIHCYIPHKFKTRVMSMDDFKMILDQASRLGVLTLVINGGEPLCHPNFLEMLELARTYDFNISILSNLTRLTDEMIETIEHSHVSEIQTSIYSLNPAIHDQITAVEGSLALTLKNTLKLKDRGISVRVACVLMKQNKDSYKDLMQWSKEHQIPLSLDYILFGRYDYTVDNLDNRLAKEEVEEIIRYSVENNDAYVRRIQDTDFQALEDYYRQFGVSCNVGRSTLCIASDGTAYPCIGWQGYGLGNIREMSIQEIWESPRLERLRHVNRTDFQECKDCKDKFFCSRCLVRNANENQGDFMKLSRQTCELAHLNRTICRDLLHVDCQFGQ